MGGKSRRLAIFLFRRSLFDLGEPGKRNEAEARSIFARQGHVCSVSLLSGPCRGDILCFHIHQAVEAAQIAGHADQSPFQGNLSLPTQTKAAEPDGLFDNSENRFDGLLPLLVSCPPLFGGQLPVLPAERADRVVVRARVPAQDSRRHAIAGRPLYGPARKHPARVAIDEQREQLRRRILLAATASVVDLGRARAHLADRVQNKLAQVIFRDPLPHIRGQEKLRFTIYGDDSGGHAPDYFFPSDFFKRAHL